MLFEYTAHFETSVLDVFAALQVVVARFTNSWETALIALLCLAGLLFMTELGGTSCSTAGTQQKNVTHIQVTGLFEINPFLHRVEKHMFYLGLSFFFTCCFTTKQIPLLNLGVWLFNGCFWELRREFSDSS